MRRLSTVARHLHFQPTSTPAARNVVFIANRGEVAVRVCRAARALGLVSIVAVTAADGSTAPHAKLADATAVLPGEGTDAYLDVAGVVRTARMAGADILHPGYGFLSENPALARACREEGIVFAGPSEEALKHFGDKLAARSLAENEGVPVLPAVRPDTREHTITPGAIAAFLTAHPGGSMVIKAVAGGGGRGIRLVTAPEEASNALEGACREARGAFGDGRVYGELFLREARHVEVQILGNGVGDVTHLGERDCSVQRRHQKLIEVAPCPHMHPRLRSSLLRAAETLGRAVNLSSLATVEFLVDGPVHSPDAKFYFLEANPRLQVEHGVTELVTGIDLVEAQLMVATAAVGSFPPPSLVSLGVPAHWPPSSLPEIYAEDVAPRGAAIQARVYAERVNPNDVTTPLPSRGLRVTQWVPPSGPGIRVDSAVEAGCVLSPSYDMLMCKIMALRQCHRKAVLALCDALVEAEFGDDVETNVQLLVKVLQHPDMTEGSVTTMWLSRVGPTLAVVEGNPKQLPLPPSAGNAIGPASALHPRSPAVDAGWTPVVSPMAAQVTSIELTAGQRVRAGQEVATLTAMKMEHVVTAGVTGMVRQVCVQTGQSVEGGTALIYIENHEPNQELRGASTPSGQSSRMDGVTTWSNGAALERLAADRDSVEGNEPLLKEMLEARRKSTDEGRASNERFVHRVSKRRQRGQGTARSNITLLVDPGTALHEVGSTVLAAQRSTRAEDWLVEHSPADGIVCAFGIVNASLPLPSSAYRVCADGNVVIAAYDATALAGTQGYFGHRKLDRTLDLAYEQGLPVILLAEGGGGRPSDVDGHILSCGTLIVPSFRAMARLSGLVPLVGIASGYCFAGNAALLGMCDVVIMVEGASVGMAGPVMIEGGGLGKVHASEVGPTAVHATNGVADIVVATDADAMAAARRYLSFFQAPVVSVGTHADQRLLRSVIPRQRRRVYDPRDSLAVLGDSGSWMELRGGYSPAMVTGMIRVAGHALGVIANDPRHLAGAIDGDGALKAARFMEMCNAHGIPLLSLVDTPGFMVGPASEADGALRKVSKMFVVGASLKVPILAVVTRRAFGLGAMAMTGGAHMTGTVMTVAWPTGSFGAMGIEGFVHFGFRAQLEAAQPGEEREELFASLVQQVEDHGRALQNARYFEVDEVVDPAETRGRITAALTQWRLGVRTARTGVGEGHRPVSTW